MAPSATPYVKSLQDELDWKLVDQLHGAVAQISGFCFETKKFCVTTQLIVLTFLLNFTGTKLDHSLFVASTAVPLCFWFLDSVAYYYQVELRGMMDAIRRRIQDRNQDSLISAGGTPFISAERTNKSRLNLVVSAAFNHSMWLYYILIGTVITLWRLFIDGVLV